MPDQPSMWGVCVECGARLMTLDNIRVFAVVDAERLAPVHMPPGGCKCPVDFDPEFTDCDLCYPDELRCKDHPPKLHEIFSFEDDGQLKLQLEGAA